MSNQNESIKKQPIDSTDEPLNNGRRAESPDGPIAVTNITDVNDFCLEHIFKYLSLIGLVNVAESCKRFQNAARLAFSTKYSNHMVRLEDGKQRTILIDRQQIIVQDFSTCLKIMRCFGDFITKLDFCSIRTPGRNRKRNEMYRYFIEYCADSVVDLEYRRVTLKYLTQPIKKVETVHFTNDDFRCKPTDLKFLFPNLRAFTMHNLNAIDHVMAHIPNLELLDISISGDQHGKLATVLRLNRQLQRLNIRGAALDLKVLRFLSECPQLESLIFWMKDFNANFNTDPIHFKSLRKFGARSCDLRKLDAAKIAITFDQLDQLEIVGRTNSKVYHLISNNSTLSKFSYWYDEEINEEIVLKFAKALPSVEGLRFWVPMLSADDVIAFMTNCPLLKYIQCQIDCIQYNRLKDMIGAEWRTSMDDDHEVTLER